MLGGLFMVYIFDRACDMTVHLFILEVRTDGWLQYLFSSVATIIKWSLMYGSNFYKSRNYYTKLHFDNGTLKYQLVHPLEDAYVPSY